MESATGKLAAVPAMHIHSILISGTRVVKNYPGTRGSPTPRQVLRGRVEFSPQKRELPAIPGGLATPSAHLFRQIPNPQWQVVDPS
jgi:hypothetical protein